MPTPSGKETASERDARVRQEDFDAIRAAITEPTRETARAMIAEYIATGEDPMVTAGARITLHAGKRRTLIVDEGQIAQLALADAAKAAGLTVTSHTTKFGIYAGRDSIRYGVGLRR